MEAAVARPSSYPAQLLRLVAEAPPVEDLEYLLGDVLGTISSLEKKRGRLQAEIAAASRGRNRRAPAPAPEEGDHLPTAPALAYTRKGAGAARKRLRAAAGNVKKERDRLEAVWGEVQEALVDAMERLALSRRAVA
ncbi:hypothetical protein BRADI_1g43190v3 [Brachypodium distachyon]|uniref:Uncharacterized protein n=1 Tax=Brachypodium distachyon TaxID=15368 RepID=I1GYX4_BRADI|nr:hypothetical protein BRADI_1g43190v3 [Brachypodium distachyon]